MSFDARSLERLHQLGRSLPQRLPEPQRPAPAASAGEPAASAGGGRHRLETETDPEALFHELMRASADGSAPPHLLERLRELEARRAAVTASAALDPGRQPADRGVDKDSRRPQDNRRPQGRRDPQLAQEHAQLYTDFQQLLLEDDEI